MKKAILLVNVGTPDSPDVRDVKVFLSRFLNDPHVIHVPDLWRKILVDMIIVPFRASKSAALYRQLWTKDGAPLRIHLENVREKLQERLGAKADVWMAMSYGKPDIAHVMDEMQRNGYRQLTVIPLFPQYAVSTTGSVEDSIKKHVAHWLVQPELTIIRQFYDHPLFLDAWFERIIDYCPEQYQRIVFSFHGLPLSHLPQKCRKEHCGCPHQPDVPEAYVLPHPCYRAACYGTARRLAIRLGLTDSRYTVAFQSRMSKRWLRPFTDDVLKELASGHSKILIVAPSFVADCLETSVELGMESKELFFENGGSAYTWVESLNDQPKWIEALEEISSSGYSGSFWYH